MACDPSTGAAALRALGLPPDAGGAALADLCALAAHLAAAPVALVTVLDDRDTHVLAAVGATSGTLPRCASVCDLVVRDAAELEVPDLRADPRFAGLPVLAADPPLLSYAGFPLVLEDGQCAGALCVLAPQVRMLDGGQREGLRVLARQVVAQLELARVRRDRQLLVEHASDVISRHAADGRPLWVSPSVRAVLGLDPEQERTADARTHVHEQDRPALQQALEAVSGDGSPQTVTVRSRHVDGSWRWLEITLSALQDGSGDVLSAARDVTERVQATRELLARNDFAEAVLDSIGVGIVACDAQGHLTLFNPTTAAFHGLPADDSVPPERMAEHFDLFQPDGVTLLPPDEVPLLRALREGQVHGQEIVIAPRGLPSRVVSCEGRTLRDADGNVAGAVVAMSDVTQARAAEQRLRAAHEALSATAAALALSEQQFRTAFEQGPLAMCRLDRDGVVLQANPAFRRLLSLPSSQLLGRPLHDRCADADRSVLEAALLATGSGVSGQRWAEVRLVRADACEVWCEVAVSRASAAADDGCLLVQLADVDSRRRREEDLQRRLARDPLTGLASRESVQQRLAELLGPDGPPATTVLYADLDGFKAVNDDAGHGTGDAVLVEVSRRLQAAVRASDLVGRLGGDEFVVVGPGDGAAHLVQRITEQMAEPVRVDGAELALGLSVGTVVARAGDDVARVLAEADAAMYQRKRAGRTPVG